jgi:DNA-directed RNA polymerase alpha subunit
MIKERAYFMPGPWRVDLRLMFFSTTSGWRCGLSPATQTSDDAKYREAVLKIARELQSTVALGREGFSGTDKEDPVSVAPRKTRAEGEEEMNEGYQIDPTPELPDDILISRVQFSTRIQNALSAATLRTVGEVREASDDMLLSLPDLGPDRSHIFARP